MAVVNVFNRVKAATPRPTTDKYEKLIRNHMSTNRNCTVADAVAAIQAKANNSSLNEHIQAMGDKFQQFLDIRKYILREACDPSIPINQIKIKAISDDLDKRIKGAQLAVTNAEKAQQEHPEQGDQEIEDKKQTLNELYDKQKRFSELQMLLKGHYNRLAEIDNQSLTLSDLDGDGQGDKHSAQSNVVEFDKLMGETQDSIHYRHDTQAIEHSGSGAILDHEGNLVELSREEFEEVIKEMEKLNYPIYRWGNALTGQIGPNTSSTEKKLLQNAGSLLYATPLVGKIAGWIGGRNYYLGPEGKRTFAALAAKKIRERNENLKKMDEERNKQPGDSLNINATTSQQENGSPSTGPTP